VYSPRLIAEWRQHHGLDKPKSGRVVLKSVLSVLGLVVVGMLFRDAVYGRLFIMVYGVVAIIVGIPAVQTFKLTAISLICIPVLALLHGTTLSEDFAQYAFLFLLIAVTSSCIEAAKSTILQRKEARIGVKTVASSEKLP